MLSIWRERTNYCPIFSKVNNNIYLRYLKRYNKQISIQTNVCLLFQSEMSNTNISKEIKYPYNFYCKLLLKKVEYLGNVLGALEKEHISDFSMFEISLKKDTVVERADQIKKEH